MRGSPIPRSVTSSSSCTRGGSPERASTWSRSPSRARRSRRWAASAWQRTRCSPTSSPPTATCSSFPAPRCGTPGGGDSFAAAAGRFLDAGVPVATICGGTAGLARAGLLDERKHTSASADYLAATGYAGASHYVDDRAVVDGDLITAGPQSPVQFARATLERLGLASERTLDAYEGLFHRGDLAAFPVLMQAQSAA
ncbi:MAG TPA: DJ-1/PfpI family protein [Thermoleophilaceae bacterium]